MCVLVVWGLKHYHVDVATIINVEHRATYIYGEIQKLSRDFEALYFYYQQLICAENKIQQADNAYTPGTAALLLSDEI